MSIVGLKIKTSLLLKEFKNGMLNQESPNFKCIKTEIRKKEDTIQPYTDYLFESLQRSNSEKRHKILSLIDYFFCKSHQFRLCIVERMRDLLRFVCEIDPFRYPLPPTKEGAKELKVYSIKVIKNWHSKYAAGYDSLNQANDFLKKSKALDYENVSAEMYAERIRREEAEQKANERAAQKANQVKLQFEGAKRDMEVLLTETDTALKILIPVFEEEECQPGTSLLKPESFDRNLHGYSANETVSILIKNVIPNVVPSEENESVIQSVKDCRVMLERHKINLQRWLQGITKTGSSEQLFKELITMKGNIEGFCNKIDELNLSKYKPKKRNIGDMSSDDDSDLEDVPEKEIEHFVPPEEIPDYIMKKIAGDSPSTSKSILNEIKKIGPQTVEAPETPKNSIPVLPFGLDLKYWGETNREPVQIPMNNADCHRFWRPPDDAERKESDDVYETRVFTFIGEERRPERKCKARLANGQLCSRMDFEKCPVHGIIIDRDEEGFPMTEQAIPKMPNVINTEAEPSGSQCIDDDPEYIRDLEANAGKSFSLKGKKVAKRVNSGQAVRNRLEKKLLNKQTVKRVSAVLDSIRKAKIQKKFGGQFAHT